MNTILLGIVGSSAYGLAHEGSDVDRLGIFAASTLDVSGLDWHSSKESRVNQGPDGDDIAYHEVGKFLRLALKANPTILELLALQPDAYETRSLHGNHLLELRSVFYSRKAVFSAYREYAAAQMKKYENGFHKPKYARHALRLLEQGSILYSTGELKVRVDNPQRYWDLVDMGHDQRMQVLQTELDAWQETRSPLPEEPDRDTVRDYLSGVRRTYMED